MDIIFKDIYGNKKNFLYQYDVGQSLVIENWEYDSPDVQFQMNSLKTTISAKSEIRDGALFCYIPDSLLTIGDNIIVYLYARDKEKGEVVFTYIINVIPRKRPSDYVYPSEMFVQSINGMIIADKQGFAEVANWEDGNSIREDRDNLFVNIRYDNNERIVTKATSLDNVDGVTVPAAGFAANCDSGKLFSSGNIDQKYALVCSFGCAVVKDDGTCVVGQMCVPTTGGVATKSNNSVGFKVLDRVDSSHVYILVEVSMKTVNNLQTKIDTNADNLNSHKSNTNNPHSVTKSQVGLGNVPNVATNDQTPTYIVATTLTKLTSGEKLSTAFGKIAKAIVDLITHIANKSNPHEVTKAQVGLGNVDNTADVDKPVSTAVNLELTRIEELVNTTQENIDAHSTRTDNPHSVTAEQVGLGNVNNTSDMDKPISTAVQTALDKKASLVDGKIPKEQLPDDSFDNIVVETISDRDALSPFAGLLVHVKDASGDSSVSSAYADYIYDGETWAITGGATGGSGTSDSVSWANITGKPSSYTPSAHASTHATGGTDAIAPSDIGAAPVSHVSDTTVHITADERTKWNSYGCKVVATITARDALTPTEGMFVHVKDATGDSTVESGYADYIYDGEAWVKIGGVYANADVTSY